VYYFRLNALLLRLVCNVFILNIAILIVGFMVVQLDVNGSESVLWEKVKFDSLLSFVVRWHIIHSV